MTASAFLTSANSLPPAFLGQPYEAAIQATCPSNPTVLTSQTGNDTGLPHGLAINGTDHVRITGTPDGLASTKAGTGVAQAGPGAYTFTISPNATDSGVVRQFTVNLYSSQSDPRYLRDMSVAQQAAVRNASDQ